MPTENQQLAERARTIAQEILHRLNEHGAAARAAVVLDISEAAVSKWKSNESAIGLESTGALLAELGLQVVPADWLMVAPDQHRALVTLAQLGINAIKDDKP